MSNLRRGPLPSELGWLNDMLDDYAERLRKLEAPSGEALSNTVATLQGLVTDIQAQLDAYMAGKYTNSQIDAKDAAVAAQIQPAINATLGGTVTIGGALLVPNAYNTDITWTRRTGWWGNDGRAGFASSAVEKKTAITPADIDADAVLDALKVREFYYRGAIRRRTALRINEGIDYVPERERGLLAHEVDEVLPWLVYHDDEGHAEGVEYAMLSVALLAVAQQEREARRALEARVAKLEGGEQA